MTRTEEAGPEVGGSRPSYYDSLRLFSPARFSALPGMRLPGGPSRYPTRDEITDYVRSLTVPRLGYVGLPGQTGPASATIRGSGADARRITRWLQRTLATDRPVPAEGRVPALAER